MSDLPTLIDPEQRFALEHVRADCRAAVAALWAFDARLGTIVATTTQPLIGQMRLTWWHEAVTRLTRGDVPPEPLLVALASHVIGDVTGAQVAALVDGWEALLDLDRDPDVALAAYGARGDQLFALTAQLCGAMPQAGGRAWALADFARRGGPHAVRAWALAAQAPVDRRLIRPLRILARLASVDARSGSVRPRTLLRLLAAAR
jgi:15-cis-phytoene synthase